MIICFTLVVIIIHLNSNTMSNSSEITFEGTYATMALRDYTNNTPLLSLKHILHDTSCKTGKRPLTGPGLHKQHVSLWDRETHILVDRFILNDSMTSISENTQETSPIVRSKHKCHEREHSFCLTSGWAMNSLNRWPFQTKRWSACNMDS